MTIHHISCSIAAIKSYLADCYGWTSDDFADYEDFTHEDWMKEIKENFSLQELWDFLGKKA